MSNKEKPMVNDTEFIICPKCGQERPKGKCRNCMNQAQNTRRAAERVVCPKCECRYMHCTSQMCRACNMREMAEANRASVPYAPSVKAVSYTHLTLPTKA